MSSASGSGASEGAAAPLVDTHTHAVASDAARYPLQPGGLPGAWYLEAPHTAEQLIELMDGAGVARAVLVQVDLPGPGLAGIDIYVGINQFEVVVGEVIDGPFKSSEHCGLGAKD